MDSMRAAWRAGSRPALEDWEDLSQSKGRTKGHRISGCSPANSGNTNCSEFDLFSVKIGRSRQVQLHGYTGIEAGLGPTGEESVLENSFGVKLAGNV